ncbi:MAG: ABC transporter permease, partial [Alphaproteobacteria bacterium]|nr:ABC transporter permease [Alphaproteobacteria bacterium]
DSHRGFRVMGTTAGYFEHYRYGAKRPLAFAEGKPFADLFDAVIGADVAKELGYRLGQAVVIAHGLGAAELSRHDDKPFRVAGILAKTGTPVDRTVHVGLEAIEAIHVDWRGGVRIPGNEVAADALRRMDLAPKTVTAVLVGLKSKMAVFAMQRHINEYRPEPLLAVLPGVALQELWGMMGVAETALIAISGFVVAAGVLGMLTMMLAGMNERRREMAILRSVGARPAHIFFLLVLEAAILTALGLGVGLALLHAALFGIQPIVESVYGLHIPLAPVAGGELALMGLVFAAGTLAGLIPAWRAYRQSLADGMIVRT